VCETEKPRPGTDASRRLTRVVFTAPEGAEITKMLPGILAGLRARAIKRGFRLYSMF
jgi:hypothetical protein